MTAAPETMAPPRIPIPPEFPVEWARPDDELEFWQRDSTHAPGQVAPLEYDLLFANFTRAISIALRGYAAPVEGMASRRINTYMYSTMRPMIASPEELQAKAREAQETLAPVMERIGELWNDYLLPEVLHHLARLESLDLPRLSDAELRDALDDAIARGERLADIHMEIVVPAYLAISEYDEMYRDLFEPDDPFESYRLLQGFPNKTTEFGHELWRLSRIARWSPGVLRVLEREPIADVIPALRASFAGRAFLAELDTYLHAYGRRGPSWGMTGPTWIEDPSPVIKNLKDYATQPDSANPRLDFERMVGEREAAVAIARERLRGYPEPVREQFELMLRSAQDGLVISEDHGFYIDSAGLSQLRRVALEAGRRLQLVGSIRARDDVFMLFAGELRAALADPAGSDLVELVAERQAEMERFAGVATPPALGSPPSGPPPQGPMMRMHVKFEGAPLPEATSGNEVRGTSGSAGKVVATARVVGSLDEAARLQPGEVLVTKSSAPPWTPLFATAAAVVTDTGGILSHCAVVAREYAIPAVVGAAQATATIKDGQTVEVDGDAGMVRILD